MDRTLRAALVAALIAFASVAGLGAFLGFDPVGSAISGLVLAVLAAVLILAAARRADSFSPPPTPPSPGFPGPPDREDGTTPDGSVPTDQADPTDPATPDDDR